MNISNIILSILIETFTAIVLNTSIPYFRFPVELGQTSCQYSTDSWC